MAGLILTSGDSPTPLTPSQIEKMLDMGGRFLARVQNLHHKRTVWSD